ncbi:MAG: LysR family transcriptional regulator [Desulfobacterales bacterium]|nr:LysR family transcriptional regulator [Desulfobacterales bacterium]
MESHEQIFLRVVEAGSLKAAAEQMGTDPSSVSRKIAALEQRLDVKLLNRSTRRSQPTEAGHLYYQGMRKLVDEKLTLEAKVTQERDTPRGTLRVSAPNNFGDEHVAPILTSMMAMYPKLKVELILTGDPQDLNREGIDVDIRFGHLPDSTLICRKLTELPVSLVASPRYLKKYPPIKTPQDLKNHDFLLFTRKQLESLIEFAGSGSPQRIKLKERCVTNNIRIIRDLTIRGFGINTGVIWAYKEQLESGEVVQVLPNYQLPPLPLYVTYRSTAFVPAKIRKFVDLMAEYTQEFFRQMRDLKLD